MKNKKAQILSIFLSACILGTSAPVSAADLSSELFSADDITDTEAPADTSQDQPAATDEASSPDSTDTLEEPADDLLQSPDDPGKVMRSNSLQVSVLEPHVLCGTKDPLLISVRY